MIELRLFGNHDLLGVKPEEATALLSQPKTAALLVHLGVAAPPGALHRRDRLVGLLWPELDQTHARTALRKAILQLRRTLGPDALATRGDEEIGLADGALWCDVVEFDDCVEKSYYSRALELYRRGDLLMGFHITEAHEFEDWLDRERTERRDKAAACAWGLAARLEEGGDFTVATQHAKRAAALAPSDERMLRRVMKLLDRLNDVAGAITVYDDFAKRLKRDHGAEPSLETKKLLKEIKERSRGD
jgi:DNA-binding SARP family transcriptional activator